MDVTLRRGELIKTIKPIMAKLEAATVLFITRAIVWPKVVIVISEIVILALPFTSGLFIEPK